MNSHTVTNILEYKGCRVWFSACIPDNGDIFDIDTNGM